MDHYKIMQSIFNDENILFIIWFGKSNYTQWHRKTATLDCIHKYVHTFRINHFVC